jgi:hypothetical protein
MDIIDRHFAAENAHDVEATIATYTDDIVWDDVTHPDAPFRGKDEVASVYSSILDAIPDLQLESVRRFSGEGGRYVVDESILSGHVDGEWAGITGLEDIVIETQLNAQGPRNHKSILLSFVTHQRLVRCGCAAHLVNSVEKIDTAFWGRCELFPSDPRSQIDPLALVGMDHGAGRGRVVGTFVRGLR